MLQRVLERPLILLLGALVGCGGGAPEPTGDVVGTVSLGPNAGGGVAVIFYSEAPRVERMTEVGANGEYYLHDLPLGVYSVYLAPVPVNYPTGEPEPPQAKIPKKLSSPDTSGLELSVVEGENRLDVTNP
ncbi:hypothetical protein KOR34_02650 [Posidoniimonas corsicana]|uniref:Cna protein B-type domain protein n=1 Tax=Posidoniimonas corsicana TaxID=1938618 RepID=A0A5C5V9U8_9BACT|nr:hypothetical protein [Posidoniimonas corsicana]TWT35374.1 hypothetical protein KOR34_02650 [Posidoniimonas corsicana]